MSKKKFRPIVLVILDGWGESLETDGNPFTKAKLPTIEKFNQYYPKILLQASGISVGLPWGEEGNSEVGHQSLGSGRIIYQSLPRIDLAIENGTFFDNQKLKNAMQQVKKSGRKFHLMGLLSDGAVHSHINHLFAALEMVKDNKLKEVYVHAFLDGRDTSPQIAEKYVKQLQKKFKSLKIGQLASIAGRYYAMDRNNNWNRTEKSFRALTGVSDLRNEDPLKAIKGQYAKKVFDEEIKPVVIVDKENEPVGKIEKGDVVFFFNFREDRARQLTKAFVLSNFKEFSKETERPRLSAFLAMTEYEKGLPVSGVVFPPESSETCLGKVISDNKLKQLRITESEKYAHVTYFFNLGQEKPFKGEDRILIPSKNAPSYAKVPEMSAFEITEKLLKAIKKDKYDFILVNYANPDMVAHTGDYDACVKALEEVDQCLEKIVSVTLARHGCLLVTADHGNVEEVLNLETGRKDTEHSNNPVPLWFVTSDNHSQKPREEKAAALFSSGILCDITPTVLELLDLPKPKSMTCSSLLPYLK